MWLGDPSGLRNLRDRLLALIDDLRIALPLERPSRTREACDDGSWDLRRLFENLRGEQMRSAD